MLGFVIGAACLLGLVAMWRRGPRACGAGHGWGGPFGHAHAFHGLHGFHGCSGRSGRGPRGGFGRRTFSHWLFERLETTPGQEKVILGVLSDLWESGAKLRAEAHRSRTDLAHVLRGAAFDETHLGELFARHDGAIEAARKDLVGAIAKVHDVLDERQRARLADLIERGGPFWTRRHGPYRDAA